MSIEWNRLRLFNGSQNSAFEALCCQLAECEPVPKGSKPQRKGTPDAGVEFYWAFPDGSEWGWQAKFFLKPPETAQWQQLDHSVRQALNKHPNLSRYTICLPLNMPDARIPGRRSMRNSWEEHVDKWRAWAAAREMSIQFEYWGEHEIFSRLTKEEHAGRIWYWFNTEFMSGQWFEQHRLSVLQDAGDRYTPYINVPVFVDEYVQALTWRPEFLEPFAKTSKLVQKELNALESGTADDEGAAVARDVHLHLNSISSLLEEIRTYPLHFSSAAYEESCSKAKSALFERMNNLQAIMRRNNQKAKSRAPDNYEHEKYLVGNLVEAVSKLSNLLCSDAAKLLPSPALLLVGKAGTGKSHLFCDVLNRRVETGLPTVLILGEKIYNREPWAQIMEILKLPCAKPSEFLGALNAAGQAKGTRALILIDAMNEGEGKRVWRKYLRGMLQELKPYPWLAVAISVRSSYEKYIIPDNLEQSGVVRIEHHGFSGSEYAACRTYFDYYGIELPNVPLLNPEFSNPLFLKLYCKGLRASGLTRVPDGTEGILKTFTFFLDSVNQKLSQPDELNFDPKANYVRRAIGGIVDCLIESESDWLPRSKAKEICNRIRPSNGFQDSLFQRLLAEGILSEEMFYDEREKKAGEGIRFTYDRLQDFLVATQVVWALAEKSPPERWFVEHSTLSKTIKDGGARWEYSGLLEMLSIVIPEKTGRELLEIVPEACQGPILENAFVESIAWRTANSFGTKSRELVRDFLSSGDHFESVLEALVGVSTRPNHPFNAELLHQLLCGESMADRDAWWSTFLHYRADEGEVFGKLVDWAWNEPGRHKSDKETVRLAAIVLCWCFSGSNRYLRDRATKALVCLLQSDIEIYNELIDRFICVDDPYVLERLLASAYGSAMRSSDDKHIGILADHVYKNVFESGTPPVHILTREYAKGIIDYAMHRGCKVSFDLTRTQPPYGSDPPMEPPTKGALKERYYDDDGFWTIWSSVMSEMGDFGNYVIDSIFENGPITNIRVGKYDGPTQYERSIAFENSLSKPQADAWNEFVTVRSDIQMIRHRAFFKDPPSSLEGMTDEQIEQRLRACFGRLRPLLDDEQLRELDEASLPELVGKSQALLGFDSGFARRWIFNRVIEFGWEPKKFRRFDQTMAYVNRSAHKAERIGKKYQWIALFELLARVCDNFIFVSDLYRPILTQYEDTGQLSHVRDIDPSSCVRETKEQQWEYEACWWAPIKYDTRGRFHEDARWVRSIEDWPTPEKLIEVENPRDSSQWLVLSIHLPWRETFEEEDGTGDSSRRLSWFSIDAHLVEKEHFGEVVNWAKTQNFRGHRMLGARSFYYTYLGEYPWSQAFRLAREEAGIQKDWTKGIEDGVREFPRPVLIMNQCYICEGSSADCSIDSAVRIELPAPWLIENMELSWRGREGEYFDANGNLSFVDPSVRECGPGALLVHREAFVEFLESADLCVFWILAGEKMVMSKSRPDLKCGGILDVSGVAWWGGQTVNSDLRSYFRMPARESKE